MMSHSSRTEEPGDDMMLADEWEVLSTGSRCNTGSPRSSRSPSAVLPVDSHLDGNEGYGVRLSNSDDQPLQLHAAVKESPRKDVPPATSGSPSVATARTLQQRTSHNKTICSGPTTIMLVGAVGSGKSSTGNRILGRAAFLARHAAGSVTRVRQSATLEDGANRYVVIDTPGLGELSGQGEGARQELLQAMEAASSCGERVAVAIVLSAASPYSAADKAATCSLVAQFGASILERSVLVFTHGDVLAADGTTLSQYLQTAPAEMQVLLEQVSGRTVLLDNKQPETQHQDAAALLSAVDAMLSGSQLSTFSMPSWASAAGAAHSSALRAGSLDSFTHISAANVRANLDVHSSAEHREEQAAQLSAALAASEARRRQLERTVREMPRLRRGIAYALTACGMLALRLLAGRASSDGINERALGSSVYNLYGPFSPGADCKLSWSLEPSMLLPDSSSSLPFDGLVALSASTLPPPDYPPLVSH